MGRWIDARQTPDGIRYRVWSSITDTYLTPPLTEAEVSAWLLEDALSQARQDHATHTADRLARAREHGTSCRNGYYHARLDEPWETERCSACGGFHHSFAPASETPRCGACGEPRDDAAHGPPCAAGDGRGRTEP